MTKSLFREGGPHKARRLPGDRYELTISIPTDADGLRGRECPDDKCSPGYFKVKPGTGVVEGQVTAFCPYCRTVAPPDKFTTKEQLRYAKETVTAEAMRGLEGMVAESLGLGSSGRRRIGAGLVRIQEVQRALDIIWTVLTLAHGRLSGERLNLHGDPLPQGLHRVPKAA